MPENLKMPNLPKDKYSDLLASSDGIIHKHTATMVLIDTTLCSGVYTKSSGYCGILTAGHCVELLFQYPKFGLMVANHIHQLWVEQEAVEHVAVEMVQTHGPDLSFLIIRNPALVKLIEDQGFTFYDLDHQHLKLFRGQLLTANWCVVGSPHEKLKEVEVLIDNQQHRLLESNAVGMQAFLQEIETRGKYDYVTLEIPCGLEEYPKEYIGVSGGGIWYQPFATTDDINYRLEPILAGITAWQHRPRMKLFPSGDSLPSRNVEGHCYRSIYEMVRKLLAAKTK
jgi:hypothetical protein